MGEWRRVRGQRILKKLPDQKGDEGKAGCQRQAGKTSPGNIDTGFAQVSNTHTRGYLMGA